MKILLAALQKYVFIATQLCYLQIFYKKKIKYS